MMRKFSNLSEVSIPFNLPELVITPDHAQLFMFSAVTWNRHQVHYNKEAALREGLPDVVVHRGLLGNFIARMLSDWLIGAGEIKELSWKVLRSAVPGRALRCRGVVINMSDQSSVPLSMVLDVAIVDTDDSEIVSGKATVELFPAESVS